VPVHLDHPLLVHPRSVDNRRFTAVTTSWSAGRVPRRLEWHAIDDECHRPVRR